MVGISSSSQYLGTLGLDSELLWTFKTLCSCWFPDLLNFRPGSRKPGAGGTPHTGAQMPPAPSSVQAQFLEGVGGGEAWGVGGGEGCCLEPPLRPHAFSASPPPQAALSGMGGMLTVNNST